MSRIPGQVQPKPGMAARPGTPTLLSTSASSTLNGHDVITTTRCHPKVFLPVTSQPEYKAHTYSTSILLAKSCHDLDLINYWMGGESDNKCISIQSYGSLQHFQPSKAPPLVLADDRVKNCFECPSQVEQSCPYSAKKIYSANNVRWPVAVVCDLEDIAFEKREDVLKNALIRGPYGRCVYKCDNDVVDHQVVNLQYHSGATVAFTMNAFTSDMRRETRICGSKGELRWDGSADNKLVLYNFNGERELIDPGMCAPESVKNKGHGGADFFLVREFILALAEGKHEDLRLGLVSALESHKLVFAAEKSRTNHGFPVKMS